MSEVSAFRSWRTNQLAGMELKTLLAFVLGDSYILSKGQETFAHTHKVNGFSDGKKELPKAQCFWTI